MLEDDPYGALRYAGETIPPIKSLDTEGLVIYLSTVSKTIAPGLRIGWVVASEEIRRKLTIVKQAADLHTSSLDQRIAHRYLTDFDSEAHVERIRRSYGERFAVMDAALRETMPPGFTWTHPQGGMFLWVTCPEGSDTSELMLEALKRKVLFVPGTGFLPRRERSALHAAELLKRFARTDQGRHWAAGGGLQRSHRRARHDRLPMNKTG